MVTGCPGFMKRFAAHYLFLPVDKLFKLHSIELNDDKQIMKISPLDREMANTFFCNGLIWAVNENTFSSLEEVARIWKDILCRFPETALPELLKYLSLKEIAGGNSVDLYHLDGIDLLSAKFRTDNCGSYCHIQRLC